MDAPPPHPHPTDLNETTTNSRRDIRASLATSYAIATWGGRGVRTAATLPDPTLGGGLRPARSSRTELDTVNELVQLAAKGRGPIPTCPDGGLKALPRRWSRRRWTRS
jgi:hypothetical protein